ncbi:hypothetical protein RJT34_33333 [Clitoria ternatea]|uniref:Uncharacterized protein n=1 Tax=Clitoria ternatea TaxID=43366 RepID=A0AAN9F1U6_CLITE
MTRMSGEAGPCTWTNLHKGIHKELGNLERRLHVASNNFFEEISHMIHVSGLIFFIAENKFSGGIPEFNFSKLFGV